MDAPHRLLGIDRPDRRAHRACRGERIAGGARDDVAEQFGRLPDRPIHLRRRRIVERELLRVGGNTNDVEPVAGTGQPQTLPERRLTRPLAPRKLGTDDRDRLRGRLVARVEVAAGEQRDPIVAK
jgi:hypothetical protein